MRLGQVAGVTDAGRKRRRNEDAFAVRPPLFAVADGMGGARAGEVASQLATSVFRELAERGDVAAEEGVVALVREANRRVYARARQDAEASGMGTTMTVALLDGERIAIGHVGDSRAYRIRAGELEQLTEDHSLVADLLRSGRLTPEEAETHPQRSVITRALGTEPEVDVDSFTVEAKAGDVFLLCSDGLTTMLGDDEILRAVRESESLEKAAKTLVKAANKRGGEDNITIVLFELEAGEPLGDTVVVGGGATTSEDLEDTLSGLEAPTLPEGDRGGVEERGEAQWVTLAEAQAKRRPRRRTGLLLVVVAVAFIAVLLAGGLWILSRAHFIGAEEDGRVAVYQGVPWELGSGVVLYRPRYVSRLQAVQLSREERVELFDHELLTYEDARDRLARYELEGVP